LVPDWALQAIAAAVCLYVRERYTPRYTISFTTPQTFRSGPLAVHGGDLVGGFMLLRRIAGAMSPLARTLLGAGLGFGFGGISEALMGGLLARGLGGSSGAALAGTAVAGAVGATLGRRILAGLLGVLRSMPRFMLWTAAISGIAAIADNWEAIKPRILAVWEDLTKAAPPWLGGQGDAAAHQRLSQGAEDFVREQVGGQLRNLAETGSGAQVAIEDAFRRTAVGQWFIQRGWLPSEQGLAMRRMLEGGMVGFGATPGDVNQAMRVAQGTTVNTGPINVTVNVQTNANPQAIGDAAGGAVQSRLRGLLSDGASLTE
jgi:hypothetical protein